MYCQNCGTVLEEGVRFCQNCGAPVSAAVNAVPIELPDRTGTLASDNKRMLVPAILAIAGAGLTFILWIINCIHLPGLITAVRYEPFYAYTIFRMLTGPLVTAAAGIFLFLFGLNQYRQGRTSMLGLSLLMLLIAYGIALLSFPTLFIVRIAAGKADELRYLFSGTNVLYMLFDTAIFVLLLICMRNAFKGKINKILQIVTAGLMLTLELIILIGSIRSGGAAVLNFLANSLYAAVLLLIAILWKPAKAE